jgi:TolB-like protein
MSSLIRKFDVHAGRGEAMKVIELRSQHGGTAGTFDPRDPVRPGSEDAGLGQEIFTPDHKGAIQKELRKVLQSPLFVHSNRLSRFLGFAVETTLAGNGHFLKEYTIGIEAYGRRHDFEPSQDSIVRTEARRLRIKLKQYYQQEGEDDPIFIFFRPGSYIPMFHVNGPVHAGLPALRKVDPGLSPGEEEVSISVVPFTYLPSDAFAEACARGLTDELMHGLTQRGQIRVFACPSDQPSSSSEDRMDHLRGARITCEGSVRTEGRRVRVMCRLYDSDGLHTASWRFDAEIHPDELFSALEKIALEIEASIQCRGAGKAGRMPRDRAALA